MKLRSLVLALTVALVSVAARAQSGVFVTFDAQQFTQQGIYLNPGAHTNTDRPWVFGPTFGGYYTINHVPFFNTLPYLSKVKTGPVAIGIDGRGDIYRVSEYGSQLDRTDGLLSLRAAPRKPFFGTSPYVIGGFGIGHTRIPFAAHYTNNLAFQFGIGADHRISKYLDWRVFEATAGFLDNYAVNNGLLPNQSNYTVSVRTGLVFRPSPPAAKGEKK